MYAHGSQVRASCAMISRQPTRPCSDNLRAALLRFAQLATGCSNPSSVNRSLKGEWTSAMNDEINALKKYNTFDVVNKPIGRNIVGSK